MANFVKFNFVWHLIFGTFLGLFAEKQEFLEKFRQNDYLIKPEWAELIRFNKELVYFYKETTFKFNRTCPAINMTYRYKTDFNRDMQVVVQVYRFASNEYRLFPLRFQVNACEALETNIAGLQNLYKCGNFTGCPMKKDITTYVCNWVPDTARFPPLIPSGSYMAELQATYQGKEVFLMRDYATVDRAVRMGKE